MRIKDIVINFCTVNSTLSPCCLPHCSPKWYHFPEFPFCLILGDETSVQSLRGGKGSFLVREISHMCPSVGQDTTADSWTEMTVGGKDADVTRSPSCHRLEPFQIHPSHYPFILESFVTGRRVKISFESYLSKKICLEIEFRIFYV